MKIIKTKRYDLNTKTSVIRWFTEDALNSMIKHVNYIKEYENFYIAENDKGYCFLHIMESKEIEIDGELITKWR